MKKWAVQILKSITTGLLGKILVSFILALPPVAGGIEYLQKGEWHIPVWAWTLSAFLLIILGLSWLVIVRIKSINKKNKKQPPMFFFKPPGGWEDLGYEDDLDVYWRVRRPKNLYSRGFAEESIETALNKIDVQAPPLCKKCETELEEKNAFLGKYTWKCINCGYQKRSKLQFFEAVEDVTKRVKGKLRKELKHLD